MLILFQYMISDYDQETYLFRYSIRNKLGTRKNNFFSLKNKEELIFQKFIT